MWKVHFKSHIQVSPTHTLHRGAWQRRLFFLTDSWYIVTRPHKLYKLLLPPCLNERCCCCWYRLPDSSNYAGLTSWLLDTTSKELISAIFLCVQPGISSSLAAWSCCHAADFRILVPYSGLGIKENHMYTFLAISILFSINSSSFLFSPYI